MENGDISFYEEPRTKKHGAWGYKVFYQEAYPHTVSTAAHMHDILEVIYVKKGSFFAIVNGVEHRLDEGSIMLFCSREIHRIYAGADSENGYYVVKIDPSVLFECTPDGDALKYILPFVVHKSGRKCFFTADEAAACGIRSCMDGIAAEYESGGYSSGPAAFSQCIGLLVAFLRYWHGSEPGGCPADAASFEIIYKALGYIHENFCEEINVADCCRRIGMSYSHFSRTFKIIVGKGFSEYVNYLRISRAEKLLITTTKTVSQIAGECGFTDAGYFIQKFKKERGTTPAKLRRDLSNESEPSE